MARRWKSAAGKIAKGDCGAKRVPLPGEGSMCRPGKTSGWTQELADSIDAVLRAGELHAASTPSKRDKLAILVLDRWQAERERFELAIATTTASRLGRKLNDLRELEEGTKSCIHYHSFWYEDLSFPDGHAAWLAKNRPHDYEVP